MDSFMAAPEPPVGATAQTQTLSFTGRAGELFPIVLFNLVLTIVTLGIYRFWARTRVRRYLWSSLRFRGDAFEYSGTGAELFIGFLIALFAVYLPIFLIYLLFIWLADHGYTMLTVGLALVFYCGFIWLLGVAAYRARRYRLSRSSWRAIRMGQTGSSLAYGAKSLAYFLLGAVTLGWYGPIADTKLWSFAINHTSFGDRFLTFDGDGRALYRRYAAYWLGSLALLVTGLVLMGGTLKDLLASFANLKEGGAPTLDPGLLIAMAKFYLYVVAIMVPVALFHLTYVTARLRFFAAHSRFDNLEFRVNLSSWTLVKFALVNWLILVTTLGLGTPFVQLRAARLAATSLTVHGGRDIDHILQSLETGPSFGEGLAEAFDIGNI